MDRKQAEDETTLAVGWFALGYLIPAALGAWLMLGGWQQVKLFFGPLSLLR